MDRNSLTPEYVKKLYESWGWNPGVLLQSKIKYYFWILENKPATIVPMLDENGLPEEVSKVILGDKSMLVNKEECILFLGYSPIPVTEIIVDGESEKILESNYHVLKFLTNSSVVFLDIFTLICAKTSINDVLSVCKNKSRY